MIVIAGDICEPERELVGVAYSNIRDNYHNSATW